LEICSPSMRTCSCRRCLQNKMELVLSSRNQKKITEVEELLHHFCAGDVTLSSLDAIGYTENIIEDGQSFAENAVIKAAVPAARGYAGIADDSGLCVDALRGAPGIYSARYAGADATDARNNARLLQELTDIPPEQRGGEFVCVMAYVCPAERMPDALRVRLAAAGASFRDTFATEKAGVPLAAFTIEGRCRGRVLDAPAGDGGFGYDPLFYVEKYDKTFAQLTSDEKNAISHRGAAMAAFASLLQIVQDWEREYAHR